MISALANHLWQSTMFACAMGLLTLMLKKNRAAVRHGLWLAASVKFLIPFSLLIGLGSQVDWRTAPGVPEGRLEGVGQSMSRWRYWDRPPGCWTRDRRAGSRRSCSACGGVDSRATALRGGGVG